MELSHLRVFLEVAKCLNFSKAAEKIHLSQPAVSIKIKSLEKHLKVKLFNRSQNKLELTKIGLKTKEISENIFSEIRLLEEYIQSEQNKIESIKIYFTNTLPKELISNVILFIENSAIDKFIVDYQSLKSESEIYKKVITNSNSIGIVSGYNYTSGIKTIPWFPQEIILYSNKKKRDIDINTIEVKNLLKMNILFPEIDSIEFEIINRRLEILGIKIEDFINRKHISSNLIESLVYQSDWMGLSISNMYKESNDSLLNEKRLDQFCIPFSKYLITNSKTDDKSVISKLIELSAKQINFFEQLISSRNDLDEIESKYDKSIIPIKNIYSINKINKNNESKEETLNINIGVQVDTIQTSIASVVPEKLDLMNLFLDDYKSSKYNKVNTKWINHSSALPIITKLMNGDLDIGIVGDYAISYLANQENKIANNLVLVSFVSINPEGSGSNLMLPKDSKISSLIEFKHGSKIASPYLSTAYGSLLYNLEKENLIDKINVEDCNIKQLNDLDRSNLDALACFTPFDYLLESKEDYQILNETISAPLSYYGVIANRNILESHEVVVKAFIKSLICSKYWFYSTPDSIKKISNWTGVNENIVNSILGSRKSKDCHYMHDLSIREDWIDHYCSKIYIHPTNNISANKNNNKPLIFNDLINESYKEVNIFN
ncbi:MAG: hypothetical protein CBC24_05910 [Candidatus Pelagibacter sp. TMED64]|nr:MAG: hypothetical protein CBC24_05910 [Candidatus Pelagibacter sp. TMED64]